MQVVPLGIGDDDDIAGGIVLEFEVDFVAHRVDSSVTTTVHIVYGHAVILALYDLQIGIQGRVIEGGGKLAYAAAGLLHYLAALIGAGVLPAVLAGTGAQGIVGGEHVAGLEDSAVDLVCAEADIVLTIAGAAGETGGIGAAQHIFALQHLPGDAGLQIVDGDGKYFAGEGIGAQYGFDERGLIDALPLDLIRIHDLILFHADGGVHGGLIQQGCQIRYETGHGILIIRWSGSDLLAGCDLLHLSHEGLIGNGLVPHEGESGVDGAFHVVLKTDADGRFFGRFLLLFLFFFLFLCCLGCLHVRVDGVVVLFFLYSGRQSLDAISGGRVYVRSVS